MWRQPLLITNELFRHDHWNEETAVTLQSHPRSSAVSKTEEVKGETS